MLLLQAATHTDPNGVQSRPKWNDANVVQTAPERLMEHGRRPTHRVPVLLVVAALAVVNGAGCRNGATDSGQTQRMADKTIQQVQEEHTDEWMDLPGVVGTALGQCEGRPCILVLTASNTAQVRQRIPSTVEGYPVMVQRIGEVRARDK